MSSHVDHRAVEPDSRPQPRAKTLGPLEPPPSSRVRRRSGMSMRRTEGRELASQLVRHAHEQSATSAAQLGRALGIAETTAHGYARPERRDALTVGDLLAASTRCHAWAHALATSLLEAVEAQRRAPMCPSTQLHRAHAELGDVSRVFVEAMRDGRLDADERRELLREVREVETVLVGLRLALQGGE